MRIAAALFVAFTCSGALASEPGQLLDCSDWVFLEPGYSCSYAPPVVCPGPRVCDAVQTAVVDNGRGILSFRQTDFPIWNCGNAHPTRTSLVRMDLVTGVETVIATLDDRCDNGCVYHFGVYGAGDMHTWFDPTGGSIIALPESYLQDNGSTNCPWPQQSVARPMTITGFATTFDVMQSYTTATSLGFRVPYMPEGMPAADHFNTYYGPLTKPLDFTKAQPLACSYPSSPPSVGDYETVTDPLPDPAPGTGRYYLTATTYQGQTRYGRKTTAGHLSGRDPALLPACVQP